MVVERVDLPRKVINQIALAINEGAHLKLQESEHMQVGAKLLHYGEASVRSEYHEQYLKDAVYHLNRNILGQFDETEIHTHMCYLNSVKSSYS